MRLFIDISAFVALEDGDDENHGKAMAFRDSIGKGKSSFRALYTSNYVMDETLTLLRMKCGHRVATAFGEMMKSSKMVKILRVTPEIEDLAWKIFKEHEDKDFSFTDCTSFAIMETEMIRAAFTFDRHFQQYKFQIVP